jgi:hypothetical protein
VLALPREGELGYDATDGARSDHVIRIVVVGLPGNQGTLAQRLSQLVPFVERFRDAYAGAVRMNDLGAVQDAHLTRYDFGAFPLGQVEHAALEFTLSAYEEEAVTVAA